MMLSVRNSGGEQPVTSGLNKWTLANKVTGPFDNGLYSNDF
jgi:hypothetical protein